MAECAVYVPPPCECKAGEVVEVVEEEVQDAEEEEEEEEEEELVDPQTELRESCSQKTQCASLKLRLEECNERVESQEKTAETCVEEIIDFMHCVDHCVAEKLFSKLK